MQKYIFFALVTVLSIAIAGCKDEEKQVCSCSSDVDVFLFFDSTEVIAIPNAFSPNADGRNDVFRVVVVGGITVVSLIIEDGGTTVFNSSIGGLTWDGRVNGTIPDCQTFDYIANVTLSNGIPKSFEGTVTVLGGHPEIGCPDHVEGCVFESQFDGAGFQPGLPSGENFDC
jgi:hypothetical protein